MSIFSVTLKKLRDSKGLSRKDLADKTGISETTVMLYETEYISPREEDLNSIAAVFDVSVDYLLGHVNYMVAEPVSIDIVGMDGIWDGVLREREVLGKVIIPKPKNSAGGRVFAIKARSDDMSASRIRKGDIIIFSERNIYNNGDIVAAKMPDGCVYIRRYFKEGEYIALSTDRVLGIEPAVTYKEDDKRYKILGKAIECRISF